MAGWHKVVLITPRRGLQTIHNILTIQIRQDGVDLYWLVSLNDIILPKHRVLVWGSISIVIRHLRVASGAPINNFRTSGSNFHIVYVLDLHLWDHLSLVAVELSLSDFTVRGNAVVRDPCVMILLVYFLDHFVAL